jgi:hypothetical protein
MAMKRPAQYSDGIAVVIALGLSGRRVVGDARPCWLPDLTATRERGWQEFSPAQTRVLDAEDSPLTLRLLFPRLVTDERDKDWVRLESTVNVRDLGIAGRACDAAAYPGLGSCRWSLSLLLSLKNDEEPE